MFNAIAVLLVAFNIALLIFFTIPDLRKDDMAICELSHSHDTCFATLNR